MTRLRLRELAEAQGLTMSHVQRQSRLTMTMVRRYWYNQTQTVRFAAIDQLATVLKIAPGDLFTQEEEALRSDKFVWQDGDIEFL